MKAKNLIESLKLLIDEEVSSSNLQDPWREELSEIVSECLQEIYEVCGIQDLERRVSLFRKVDTGAIRQALEIIEASNPPNRESKDSDSEPPITTAEILKYLKEGLDVIEENQTRMGQLEVLFRLELIFDTKVDDLLTRLNPDDQAFEKLKDLALQQLNNADQDSILLIWARLKSSFSHETNKSKYVIYDDIIPPTFWNPTDDIDEIRKRYAYGVVKYKPLTQKRMVSEGYRSFPLSFLGLMRILAFSAKSPIDRVSNIDLLKIRSISKVIALYELLTFKDREDLARSIHTEKKGLIFDGEFFHDSKKEYEKIRDRKLQKRLLINALHQTLLYCEDQFISDSNIEQALFQYKLGQEIISPSQIRKPIFGQHSKTELRLQQYLSKFLVERNILSFGTKYGRSEIDLYIKGGAGEDFVIELKLYKTRPSSSGIRKNLVQLKSYMDLHMQPRGILVLYNLSNDVVVAPRRWLKGRIWVMTINLCSVTPSKRTRSLEIIESPDANRMIDFIENN